MALAHSRNATGRRHDLVDHLRGTADLAASFASAFDATEAAWYLGLWHDLGKFNPRFQEYLLACEANPAARGHGPDHKGAGAQLAARHLGLPALLVQGHHGGLKARTAFRAWLAERATDPAVSQALDLARQALPDLDPEHSISLPTFAEADSRAAEFFLRMLFSTLVDADFLDTERHFRAETASLRGSELTLDALWERFRRDQDSRFVAAPTTTVNHARRQIYEACLAAAEAPPGIFTLTVPTGGGKTRSAMAFALRHALRNKQERIVVAVPFISITEQTAATYRSIFELEQTAEMVVLEHHSNVIGAVEQDEDFHPRQVSARLAAENWDAPVIVTTTVQLFESLFGNATSRCRKLHRLAHSVIVLDEAQALPPSLLEPILDGLRELCANYGASVVISTATQPAFEAIPPFASVPSREIVREPGRFFRALQRVEYEWRTEIPLSWPEIAGFLRSAPQALAVVNTKNDAITLLEALNDPTALHLSTLLCGAHRRVVIEEVKRRLAAGEPCRLVSTQVIEAGVDLDFPLVVRALGPLDGIIQAAGRCNREGRLQRGQVIVVRPADGGMPPGSYATAAQITRTLLSSPGFNPDDVATSSAYFHRLFTSVPTDREAIQATRTRLDYPEVARKFRMIDDDTESVAITRYGSSDEQRWVVDRLEQLRQGRSNPRLLLRQLQPYLVSVRKRPAERYHKAGLIAPVLSSLGEWLGGYDSVRGLIGEDPSPDDLVV